MKILNVREEFKKTFPEFPQKIICEKCGTEFEIESISDCYLKTSFDYDTSPHPFDQTILQPIGKIFYWHTKCPCGNSIIVNDFYEKL